MAVLAVNQQDLGAAVTQLIRALMYGTGPLDSNQQARVEGMANQVASAMRTTRLGEGQTARAGVLRIGSHDLAEAEIRRAMFGLGEHVTTRDGADVVYLGETVQGHRFLVDHRRITVQREILETVLSRVTRTRLTEAEDKALRAAAERMARRIGKSGDEPTIAKFHSSMRSIVTADDTDD